jgi:hypothetical protein
VGFKDFILLSVFMVNYCLAKVVLVKFAIRPRLCAVLCETLKEAVNLSVHQDGRRPSAGISEILKSQCHAITNKYPEAVYVVQMFKITQ